jgi:extracellular matrix protein 14
MRLVEALFPSFVSTISVGKSYEGRDILGLRVGASSASDRHRKAIVVTGGIHAREWISTTTVSYVAWSFITHNHKDSIVTQFLEHYDLIFIPVLNPDGFDYTWQVDRLWRKTRQHTAFPFCRGIDLDRAFGYEWSDAGDPCSEFYPGAQPFEAVEAQQFAEWAANMTRNDTRIIGMIDLHSYSQQVLFPYSFSCDENPPNLENLEELAAGLAKAIRLTSGESYAVRSACEGAAAMMGHGAARSRIETGSGSAIDWFNHELQARYSYQIRLRDTGSHGFLLPKESIIPTGEEIFSAFRYLGDFLLGNNGIESLSDSPTSDSHSPVTDADESEEEEKGLPEWAELRR